MDAPAPVQIAPMRRRHLRAVLGIEQQVHPRPWSAGLFESELSQKSRHYLVAQSAGRRGGGGFGGSTGGGAPCVLGYGGIMLAIDEVHVTNIATDPAVQRRGVASHLMIALLDTARAIGARAATLEVRTGNHGAQRLYRGFGFAPVGVRPGYYTDSGEDAIIMWVYDIDGPEYAARLDRRRSELAQQAVA